MPATWEPTPVPTCGGSSGRSISSPRRFPDLRYAMLHPGPKDLAGADDVRRMVEAYARMAEHARGLRSDFQLCFHNHYDSNGETADQVRTYLQAIAEVGTPALRWGVDTAHAHGMHADYLTVLGDYAHLVGDFFHIKGRIPAFDQLHEPAAYRADRDIWSNPAEVGSGLYGGFVNVADPEVETPLAEAFAILRRKARPTGGVVRGALEIDVPRQHPRLEVLWRGAVPGQRARRADDHAVVQRRLDSAGVPS